VARFNVITNLTNGAGLQREYVMLRAELERRGHTVHGIPHKGPRCVPQKADVNVYLETVVPSLRPCARENWVVPDPEWWFTHWPIDVWDRVLTKTHEGTRLFRTHVGDRCTYLGWQARDVYDAAVPRARRFLHVAGKSRAKNTEAVLEGAKRARVPVTVIARRPGEPLRVADAQLDHMLNAHAFCLLPSAYEGYGHSLHEAYGCGQVVITTDAAPMNETGPAILIPPDGCHPSRPDVLHRVLHRVTGAAVAAAMHRALALTDAEIATMSQEIRAAFAGQRAEFQANLDAVLGAVA